MNKALILLVTSFMLVSAHADIAVDLANALTSGIVYQPGGSTEVNEALVQLIWSPSDAAQANANNANLLGANEHLLNSLITPAGPAAGRFPSQGILTYADSDVGDTDILAGYFFVRIFDNSQLNVGDYYLQQYVQTPTLTEYDSLTPSTIYETSGFLGGTLDDIGVGGGNQVVPEPAVASLIGLFGIGTFFSRRIFRKD